MNLTIRDLYEECAKYEYSYMAHCIYWLLLNKKATLDDDVDSINFDLVDREKVNEMYENNHLMFKKIKLFSLKLDDRLFAFVFAKGREEAIQFTKNKLRKTPRNCHEYWMEFEMERGNEVLSFREMKNEHTSFPALAGYYEKEATYR